MSPFVTRFVVNFVYGLAGIGACAVLALFPKSLLPLAGITASALVFAAAGDRRRK